MTYFTVQRVIEPEKIVEGLKIPKRVEYYAGYQCESWADSGVLWNRTITSYCKFLEPVADQAVRQLTEKGYTVEKVPLIERKKKHG